MKKQPILGGADSCDFWEEVALARRLVNLRRLRVAPLQRLIFGPPDGHTAREVLLASRYLFIATRADLRGNEIVDLVTRFISQGSLDTSEVRDALLNDIEQQIQTQGSPRLREIAEIEMELFERQYDRGGPDEQA